MRKVFLLIVILLSGCSSNDIYVIGLSTTLSGTNSSIGISEMYGAELAVEQINAAGGVNGKKLVLEIRDDFASPIEGVKADNELKELGAVAIIGHGFSSVAEETVDNANKNDILLISPSIGTDLLTDIDDLFIRLVPTAKYEASSVANIILETGADQALLLYDTGNIALTSYHIEAFKEVFDASNRTAITKGFTTGSMNDYAEISDLIKKENIKVIFIVASSHDSAAIIQVVRNNDYAGEFHLSAWASTGDILTNLGQFTDGLTLYNFYNDNDVDEDFQRTKKEYFDRYGSNMNMVASYAYDAVYMLAEALDGMKDVSSINLKKKIISIGHFKGVQSDYFINFYGDVEKEITQFIIVDNKIIIKEG